MAVRQASLTPPLETFCILKTAYNKKKSVTKFAGGQERTVLDYLSLYILSINVRSIQKEPAVN